MMCPWKSLRSTLRMHMQGHAAKSDGHAVVAEASELSTPDLVALQYPGESGGLQTRTQAQKKAFCFMPSCLRSPTESLYHYIRMRQP
eukprot:2500382-Amphidinium_carterae.1